MNNIKNKLIKKNDIELIINRFMGETPIKINNIKQLQTAFMHKSLAIVDQDNDESDNCSAINSDKFLITNNERLEFLGDRVIEMVTSEFLFDTYPDKDQGFLTKIKSKMVKKKSLSMLGERLGFKQFMLLSSHIERIYGRENVRLLEDIFESFVGALYKDQKSDLNICRKFVLGVYAEFIDIDELINTNDNYKDSLLRYFHSKSWDHPVYKPLYYTGPVYMREFTIAVLIPNDKPNLPNLKDPYLVKKQKHILTT